jgi:hypothetical protein
LGEYQGTVRKNRTKTLKNTVFTKKRCCGATVGRERGESEKAAKTL